MTTSPHPPPSGRRGVLLLLVLSALTLFIMLGALMLVTATRARTSARAFADAASSASAGSAEARAVLDDALMMLLRGSKGPMPPNWESILEDKYGAGTLSGSTARLTGNVNSDPVLLVDIVGGLSSGTTAVSGTNPPQFAGRILTLIPTTGQGSPASFRIIGSNTSSTPTLYVANVPFRSGLTFVTGSMYGVRINGREFTPTSGTANPESYDGYDDNNRWLAQPTLAAGGTVSFLRTTGFGTTSPPQVDNDNDGFLDGAWIDGATGFPASRPSPLGGTLTYRVSYLVLDLDGRLNVNAAGIAAPPPSGTYPIASVPLGMGYGPADIDGSLVLSGSLPPSGGPSSFGTPGSTGTASIWGRILLGGAPLPASGSPTQRRPPPGVGTADGRYGPNRVAGSAGDDAGLGQVSSASTGWYQLVVQGTTGNAVTDLKSRRAVYTTGTASNQVTPTLRFDTPDASQDWVDDPYESRFDLYAKRSGATQTTASGYDDNPFGVADLERVLRANDADASTLPQRLAALLEDRAQALRMSITTDSWDTPALTGSAAAALDTQRLALPPQYPWQATNCWSPDIAAGLKFDLNRTVSGTAQAADYCRGLYTLAILLGATNQREAAQWAVNVLDFRDEDSTMTRFDYDRDFNDGWNPSGNDYVYGFERPELLLAETAAWWDTTGSGTGQLFVNLFCPEWNAVDSGTATTTRMERRHTSLGDVNSLKLADGGSSIWQVRFENGKAVQFQPISAASTPSQTVLTGTGIETISTSVLGVSAGVATIGSGSNLCLQSPSPDASKFTIAVTNTMSIDQGGGFQLSSSGTVYLERLADPSSPHSTINPYVRVDEAPVNVISVNPGAVYRSERREGPGDNTSLANFWKSKTVPGGSTVNRTYQALGLASGTCVPWFHWPNRPLISQAELALVPSEPPPRVLPRYAFPTSSLVLSGSVGEMLLDSTHVPTLFAENTAYTSGSVSYVADCGLNQLGKNTFSKWREPGRINVNTLVSASAAPSPPPFDSVVWHTLIGSGTGVTLQMLGGGTATVGTTNPFVSGSSGTASTPAQSIAHMLTLSGVQTGTSTLATLETSGTGTGPRDRNPAFAYALANRLANTATIRSNVFAVWITLEIRDNSPSADPSPKYRRLFAIIDRSIPVGYSRGEDLNARQTIRLLRYLE